MSQTKKNTRRLTPLSRSRTKKKSSYSRSRYLPIGTTPHKIQVCRDIIKTTKRKSKSVTEIKNTLGITLIQAKGVYNLLTNRKT